MRLSACVSLSCFCKEWELEGQETRAEEPRFSLGSGWMTSAGGGTVGPDLPQASLQHFTAMSWGEGASQRRSDRLETPNWLSHSRVSNSVEKTQESTEDNLTRICVPTKN